MVVVFFRVRKSIWRNSFLSILLFFFSLLSFNSSPFSPSILLPSFVPSVLIKNSLLLCLVIILGVNTHSKSASVWVEINCKYLDVTYTQHFYLDKGYKMMTQP